MNIALEKTEEYVNGKLRRNYGDAFVRGNNGASPYYPPLIKHLAYWNSSSLHLCQLIRINTCVSMPPMTTHGSGTSSWFHCNSNLFDFGRARL